MIVYTDAKALEIRTKAELCKDPILIKEINSGEDLHTINQREFTLPDRLTAKKMNFRLIYEGSAYAYSVDPDFLHVGYTQEDWQEVINKFFNKYHVLKQHHKNDVRRVLSGEPLVIPTGRKYFFQSYIKNGERKWPYNQIYNHPNQGFGAEIMALYRVLLRKNLELDYNRQFRMMTPIHDSVSVDTPLADADTVAKIMLATYKEIKPAFRELFDYGLVVDFEGEVKMGQTLGKLEDYNA